MHGRWSCMKKGHSRGAHPNHLAGGRWTWGEHVIWSDWFVHQDCCFADDRLRWFCAECQPLWKRYDSAHWPTLSLDLSGNTQSIRFGKWDKEQICHRVSCLVRKTLGFHPFWRIICTSDHVVVAPLVVVRGVAPLVVVRGPIRSMPTLFQTCVWILIGWSWPGWFLNLAFVRWCLLWEFM